MNPTGHLHCVETIDPFLRAFRAEAAARYERMQAARRRAEFEESIRCRLEESTRGTRRRPSLAGIHLLCLLVNAQASVASRRGAP